MSQVPLSQVLRVHYANRIHIPSSLSFCLQPITLNTKFVFVFFLALRSSIFRYSLFALFDLSSDFLCRCFCLKDSKLVHLSC